VGDVTGYKNVDQLINVFSKTITSATSTGITSQCIINTTSMLTNQYFSNQWTALQLLSTKIITKGSQINRIIQLSAVLGVKSISYLGYHSRRIFGIDTTANKRIADPLDNEENWNKALNEVNEYFDGIKSNSSSPPSSKSKKKKKTTKKYGGTKVPHVSPPFINPKVLEN
jgi:hypothetical protein